MHKTPDALLFYGLAAHYLALTGFSAMIALAQPDVQTSYPKLNVRAATDKAVVNRDGVLDLSYNAADTSR